MEVETSATSFRAATGDHDLGRCVDETLGTPVGLEMLPVDYVIHTWRQHRSARRILATQQRTVRTIHYEKKPGAGRTSAIFGEGTRNRQPLSRARVESSRLDSQYSQYEYS